MRTLRGGRGSVAWMVVALLTGAVAVPGSADAARTAAPDMGLTAEAHVDEVKLTFYNGGVAPVVRGKAGTVAPATPDDGFNVPTDLSILPSATATDLEPGQPYSFSVFACNAPSDCNPEPAVITVGAYVVQASVSPDRTTYGKPVTISGIVTDALTGQPVEYADIRIVAHILRTDQAGLIAEDFSRTGGRFSIPFAPPEGSEFGVVAVGDKSHLGGVGVTRSVSVSAAAALVGLHGVKKGTLGTTFVLVGGGDPIITSQPLVLQEKIKNKWKTVLKQKPTKRGITRFKVTPATRGKHVYRMTKPASPGVGSNSSNSVTLTVT